MTSEPRPAVPTNSDAPAPATASSETSKGKGWRQIKVIVPAVFLLAAAASAFVYRHQRLSGLPDPGDPFHDFAAASAPDAAAGGADANAYRDYGNAAEQLVEPDSGVMPQVRDSLERGWSAATPALRDWLEQNRPALELWRAGTEKPRCDDPELSTEIGFPPAKLFERLYLLAQAAQLEAARVTDAGKLPDAWNWHLAVFRCSRHWGQNGRLSDRVAATKLHELAVEGICQWSADRRVDAALLDRAVADLREADRMTQPIEPLLRNEYLAAIAELQNSQYLRRTAASRGVGPIPLYFLHEPEYSRRVLGHVFANWRSELPKPLAERNPIAVKLPRLYASGEHLPPAEQVDLWLRQAIFARSGLPAVERADEAILSERARQSCLLVALAAQRAYRRDGKFPESIDELTGGALAELPADPFGPPGAVIRYRRDDGPGRGAVVWSVGADGIDSGGKSRLENGASDDIALRIGDPAGPTGR